MIFVFFIDAQPLYFIAIHTDFFIVAQPHLFSEPKRKKACFDNKPDYTTVGGLGSFLSPPASNLIKTYHFMVFLTFFTDLYT